VGELVCVSGHTHCSHDFVRDGVRYISNARGYPDEWDKTGYSEGGCMINEDTNGMIHNQVLLCHQVFFYFPILMGVYEPYQGDI
jgi:hypothetical protein